MNQLFYQIIYNNQINWVLRNINKVLLPVLPEKLKIPPSGILRIKNREGKVMKLKTNQTNYLTKVIFWEGGYENFEYTQIFLKLIKKVRTFYDIGANIGYYSLLAAMENENIKVVGFEPAQGPLYYFNENVSINNFKNIKVESIALSHKDGEIEFYEIRNKKYKYLKHNLAGESNAGSLTTGRNFEVNKVKTSTVDEYVFRNNETNIDLIKIDTEGTEHLILEKSGYVLKEMKPIVICEILFNVIEKELEEIMSSYGYEFYYPTQKGLEKQSTIVRKFDNGMSNCFFVHPSKKHLIGEFIVN
jgi:FkbM family methyltransferase